MGINTLHSTLRNQFVWMKLPGLPLEFWTKWVFAEIGDSIGYFFYVDPKLMGMVENRVTWILVEMGLL